MGRIPRGLNFSVKRDRSPYEKIIPEYRPTDEGITLLCPSCLTTGQSVGRKGPGNRLLFFCLPCAVYYVDNQMPATGLLNRRKPPRGG